MDFVTLRAGISTSIFINRVDTYLISADHSNMNPLTKVIAAFLLACLCISATALPSGDTLALDDPLPLNNTLPVDDNSSGDDTVSLDDTPPSPPPDRGPPREGWRSAHITCEWKYKGIKNTYKIMGEGYFDREEEIEGKVKKAADRTGTVTEWSVKHYPPAEGRKSSSEIKVSPHVPSFVACRYFSFRLLFGLDD